MFIDSIILHNYRAYKGHNETFTIGKSKREQSKIKM